MRDENGHNLVTKAQQRAHAIWSEYHRSNQGSLPVHEFRLPPAQMTQQLSRFDLVEWIDQVTLELKYGWVTGRKLQVPALSKGSPVFVTVTEIPTALSPAEAIQKTANPFPVRLCILKQRSNSKCFEAFIPVGGQVNEDRNV